MSPRTWSGPPEYDVPDREGNGTGELIVVLSTITDPAAARADELAAAYHQRWAQETANDQLKTHCAMRCSVISLAERGEMGGISLDPMAYPAPKGNIGDGSMPGN